MTQIDNLQDRLREEGERDAVSSFLRDPSSGKQERSTVVRERVVDELRRLLPRMSEAPGAPRALSFGIADLDSRLHHGGLAFGALHEVVPAREGDGPAAFGFIMALLGSLPPPDAVLFVSPRRWRTLYGQPHGHGLNALGLNPSRVLFSETADDKQTLWVIEETLRAQALTAVAGVVELLDLKTSQKLQFTARETNQPLLLLRPAKKLEASAAMTRWRVGTAEAVRDRFGLIKRWRWRLRLERCRNGRGGEWFVEFDHVSHRFSLDATLAGLAVSGRAGAQSRQRAG